MSYLDVYSRCTDSNFRNVDAFLGSEMSFRGHEVGLIHCDRTFDQPQTSHTRSSTDVHRSQDLIQPMADTGVERQRRRGGIQGSPLSLPVAVSCVRSEAASFLGGYSRTKLIPRLGEASV